MAQSTDRLAIPDFDTNGVNTLQRQIRDILAWGFGARRAQGSLTFSGQPADAEELILDDGRNTVTFEADDDGSITAGNVSVTIGSDAEETLDNLLTAIAAQVPTTSSASDPLEITGTKTSSTLLNLKNDRPGTAGNTTITNGWANLTEVNFTLGADIGQLDTEMTAEVVVGDIDLGALHLLNKLDAQINPATEDTLLLLAAAAIRAEKTITEIAKTVPSPGTPVPFGASAQIVSYSIRAGKVAGENTGVISVGTGAVHAGTNKQNVMFPGDMREFICPVGVSIDLDELFVDALTIGDGITGTYLPA